jgi:hypothetical protein
MAQALPMSIPGLILVFFFRKQLAAAMIAGAVGASVLPLLGYLLHASPKPDIILFAGVWGGLYGLVWGLLVREKIAVAVPTNNPELYLSNDLEVEPDLDTSAWATIKEYDKNVSQALKKITPLGEGWVVEFGNRIMAADPKVRDANEIAEQVVEEYQNSQRISEVDEINAAYAEVKSNFGKYGEAQFEKLYSLVGDAMDISKAMASIESQYHAKLRADEQAKNESYFGYEDEYEDEDDYDPYPARYLGILMFIVAPVIGLGLILFF